jgi:hypothetical protein
MKAGAVVIQQPEKIFPGKGNAMKAGLREAIKNQAANVALFLDADIKNLSSDWIDKLVDALIQNNCDMSRGYYERQSRDALITCPGSEAKHASFSYSGIKKVMLLLLNSSTRDLSTSSGVRNFDISIPSLFSISSKCHLHPHSGNISIRRFIG